MPISLVVPGLAAGVGVRLSPDGATAYYVEWSIGRLCKADVASGAVTVLKDGLEFPQDVLVDWATGDVFVSERTGSIVQVVGSRIKRDVAEPGHAPHQLALVTRNGRRLLYSVCYDSGRLLQIDLNAGGAITVVCAGLGHPVGLAVDEAGKRAFVTEQDSGRLTRVEIATGAVTPIHSGLVAPFYLAWDKTRKGLFCVQRDPANSLLHIALTTPPVVTLHTSGLAWRPSGVATNVDDSLIYICSDRELDVISPTFLPPRPPARPPFTVASVEFNFRGRSLALKDHHTGPLPTPEFLRGVRNLPAAYVRGSTPRIRVVLRQLPGFAPGAYTVGATGSHGGVHFKTVTPTFTGGLSAPIDFDFMWPLPGTVQAANVHLDWWARRVPGPAVTAAIGSETHRIYVVLATPTAPWVQERPWVAALERACGWAAGAGDVNTAAGLVTEHYNGCGVVSYDTSAGATFYGPTLSSQVFFLSQMLDRLAGGAGLGGKVNCSDSAHTVSTLSNILGCDLWSSRMYPSAGGGFALNPLQAIGYNTWAVPFSGSFSYHEVAWKGACTEAERIFDGCLHVDSDANPNQPPHTPLLPKDMLFGDCAALNYRARLSSPSGCPQCQPQPGSRIRLPVQ